MAYSIQRQACLSSNKSEKIMASATPVLDLEAVFNEAAFPEYTYVAPKEYPFIKSALHAKGKHVTIAGASGSGKTTVVNKILRDLGIQSTEILLVNGREFKNHANYLE